MSTPSKPPLSVYFRAYLVIAILTAIMGLVFAAMIFWVAEMTAPGTLPFLHLFAVTWAGWATAIYYPGQRFLNMRVEGPKGEVVYMVGGEKKVSKG
jgi:hypothetical protein